MEWLSGLGQLPDDNSRLNAQQRQMQLTKPPGSLGELEKLVVKLAGLQRNVCPSIEQVAITIFAADHGVAEEGVSAFPQAVTAQMVQNFLHGGAAINVLANYLQAQLSIVDAGVKTRIQHPDLIMECVAAGTENSLKSAAMLPSQLEQAFLVGKRASERAVESGVDLFIVGEMGIANTTSATVLYCALTGQSVMSMTGAGTGLDQAGIARKADVIEAILKRHSTASTPLEQLAAMGGFEIVALVGAYIHAAQRGLPVLVDGFISSIAALFAVTINESVRPWLFLAHQSAERGHQRVIKSLNMQPLLNIGMRLGEGSGAAVAVPLMQQACKLHAEMATFAEATVATKER